MKRVKKPKGSGKVEAQTKAVNEMLTYEPPLQMKMEGVG